MVVEAEEEQSYDESYDEVHSLASATPACHVCDGRDSVDGKSRTERREEG
jgi:hypothetical protein